MKTATRSALATVTSILVRAGFKAVVHTGRNRRPGFATHDGRTLGVAGGVVLFDYTRGNGDFSKMCDAARATRGMNRSGVPVAPLAARPGRPAAAPRLRGAA